MNKTIVALNQISPEKTLRKTSFENFDRLSVMETSQLYGGTGNNLPTIEIQNCSWYIFSHNGGRLDF